MAVIAHCKTCDARALVQPDQTVQAPCDCTLRDPGAPWEVVEYVPARQLAGAVEALREIARLPCQYPDDPEQDSKMALDSVKAQEIAHAALGGQ